MHRSEAVLMATRAVIVGAGTAGIVDALSSVPFADVAGVLAALALCIREARLWYLEARKRRKDEKEAEESGNGG